MGLVLGTVSRTTLLITTAATEKLLDSGYGMVTGGLGFG